jgi:hypothetical protein
VVPVRLALVLCVALLVTVDARLRRPPGDDEIYSAADDLPAAAANTAAANANNANTDEPEWPGGVTRAQHRIASLPGVAAADLTRRPLYGGHVPIYEASLRRRGTFYYLLAEKETEMTRTTVAAAASSSSASSSSDGNAPLIVWLQGGPGCSSVVSGAFGEIGPLVVDDDTGGDGNGGGGGVRWRRHRWSRRAHVLFVDQPVGVGFSRDDDSDNDVGGGGDNDNNVNDGGVDQGGYATSQAQVNVLFTAFLKRWFTLHPQHARRPVYFAGESYAGTFILHIMAHLTDATKKREDEKEADSGLDIDLRGALLGSAWLAPLTQTLSYVDFAR